MRRQTLKKKKIASESERITERLARVIPASNRAVYYPMVVKEAHDCTVTDVDGKSYLDFNAGWTVAGVGYSNPEVIEAIKNELDIGTGLSAATFPTETTARFAERLIEITPGDFEKKVWFGHSGTDSCAAAYKLIPLATKRNRIISFYGSMHGTDVAGLAMGGHHATTKFPVPNLVTKVPYAYCYRCPYGLEYPSCNIHCASEFIEENVLKYISPPEDTSFLIVEPIQSDSGDVVPPDGYLEKLKRTCDKFGILFVDDEVKIGFGRTGKMFGIQHTDVIPDAIALGKSIASGMPVGALVARKGLMEKGFAVTTLGGNPIGAAAGLATLGVLEKSKLPANAAKMGRHMVRLLNELKRRHQIIGDVRGKGLIVGIEFVKNRKTKEPAKKETAKIVYRAWQLGLITAYVGANGNVMEITPPLTITKEQVEEGVGILERAIRDVQKGVVTDAAVKDYTGF